jgi:putative ABC transport system permease protein
MSVAPEGSQPPRPERAPRLYRWLMLGLPGELRRRFGGEIEALFAARLARAGSRRGRLRVWVRGLADLGAHSLAERTVWRRRPSPRVPPLHPTDTGRSELMESTIKDVVFALRGLRRSLGFAAVVILTLALGIGATSAVFSVVNALLLRPLPYAEPQRLVAVWPQRNMNKALVRRLAAGVPALAAVSGVSVWTFIAAGDGAEPEEVKLALVSPQHFDLLGVAPMIGRTFRPEEGTKGNAGVVVLSYDFWTTRYGADPEILGRRIHLAGADYDERTVIGVMPPEFRSVVWHPVAADGLAGWVPLEEEPGATLATDKSWYVNWTVGRLAPGASAAEAEAQLRAIAPTLRSEVPEIIDEEDVRQASIEPLRAARVGRAGGILWLLLGAVSLVLLIACANVANLQLARGERQWRELAVRRALGARAGRLVRQLLTESAVLALVGGALGVALAHGLLRLILSRVPPEFLLTGGVAIDGTVLAFALVVTLLSAFGFGLAPALRARRAAAAEALRQGSRGWGEVRRRGMSSALVAAEVALAVLIVVGSGLTLRTLSKLSRVEPGFDPAGLAVLRPNPPPWHYRDPAARQRFYAEALARLRELPQVESAAGIQLVPVTAGNWSFPTYPEGLELAPGASPPLANFRIVTPGYFATVRIPLLRGRALADDDRADAPKAAVVNHAFADRFWPGRDPIGREVRIFSDGNAPWRVVGVVGDVHQSALDAAPQPEMYVDNEQLGWDVTLYLMVRVRGEDPLRLAPTLRQVIWQIDDQTAIAGLDSMDRVIGASAATARFLALLLGSFALLALVLSAVGVYGVTAYTVARRRGEFGVRVALGAAKRQIVGAALRRGLLPVAAGVAVGAAAASLGSRLLRGLLFGVEPGDPPTFLAVVLLLGLVGIAATVIPAWRATRLDPATVLRAQ